MRTTDLVARLTRTAAIVACALAAGACDERLRDVTGPSPDLVPTFTSIQAEIFESTDLAGRVACVNCHTGRIPNIALNFSPGQDVYAQLVGVPSRQRPQMMLVAPGDPENSYLVHKLEGRPGIIGLRMPRSGAPFLTEGQMLVIKRWIEIGAPR
jgi:hypothetical protein